MQQTSISVTFSTLSSWKRNEPLIISFIDSFHNIYRDILRVLREITNSSKLGLSEGFLAQLCGFPGGWKGVSPPV